MFDELLTIDELDANTRRLAADPRVSITAVGTSRLGRPIEMISLGQGDRNALIVGVPHPNEPAGALTIERMIALLLGDEEQQRGYRWHFIKAIDPDGLHLNRGWLKRRTVPAYLENFFRPALHRQPETTFPLDIPDCHFDASTPENEAWQRAFALTRPSLHATLHHCDFGGVFYSLSRALPAALPGLQRAATQSGLGLLDHEDDVMDAERWAPAINRYPSVPELIAKAKANNIAWAYPWQYGEMSPGYGEAQFGTFTLVAEVSLWDAQTLHETASSGVSAGQQRSMLDRVAASATDMARRHIDGLARVALEPDELECLWAIQRGLAMIPTAPPQPVPVAAEDSRMLSKREFEIDHTQKLLFTLRTYGLMIRLTSLVTAREPGNTVALLAHREAQEAMRSEMAAIEARTTFVPVPLSVVTDFQMQSIFVCADALAADAQTT